MIIQFMALSSEQLISSVVINWFHKRTVIVRCKAKSSDALATTVFKQRFETVNTVS